MQNDKLANPYCFYQDKGFKRKSDLKLVRCFLLSDTERARMIAGKN